jgi:hypothetical protein
MASLTFIIPPQLQASSPAATELFFGVLSRTFTDNLGPVLLPTICHPAARELVALGLAKEPRLGCFILRKKKVRIKLT